MAVSARRGSPLTPEEIYSTALRLVDQGGVEALSMRKLAAELNVNPMSLYHHVDGKDALMRELCVAAAEWLRLPPDDGSPWQEQLRALALAYHAHARAHPALWTYVYNHPEIVADRRISLWQVLYRVLRLAGVPEPDLERVSGVLHAFVSGFIFGEMQGTLVGGTDDAELERTFDTAVELIIHGLAGHA
ncbi:TetR/AcrR family transcriptional regulator [Nonomuraea sp. NN258]|uniref:TetR/AcrR family transcriptional regulator n=1 Tax=Nonomuraea antri TaxID=2730852 RepID=UPI0015681D6A|nr:TetR/AcrR family transcriptional regulator [Nonomuraea antri]NRQ37046.1 TetR/AcrR family transcriptional regulator [Nonomuraea antri]